MPSPAGATYNGGFGKQLTATAIAQQGGATRDYCILALASSGASGAIQANGVPFANMNGCNPVLEHQFGL